MNYSRREILKQATAAGATLLAHTARAAVTDREIEIQVTSISPHTVRLTVVPIQSGRALAVPDDGALVQTSWGKPAAILRDLTRPQQVKAGNLRVDVTPDPLAFTVRDTGGTAVQELQFDPTTGSVSFKKGGFSPARVGPRRSAV